MFAAYSWYNRRAERDSKRKSACAIERAMIVRDYDEWKYGRMGDIGIG